MTKNSSLFHFAIVLISLISFALLAHSIVCPATTAVWTYIPPGDASTSQGSIQVQVTGKSGTLKFTAQKISKLSPDLSLVCENSPKTQTYGVPLNPDPDIPTESPGAIPTDTIGFTCQININERYPVKFVISDSACSSIYSFPGYSTVSLRRDPISRVMRLSADNESSTALSQTIIEPQSGYESKYFELSETTTLAPIQFYYIDSRTPFERSPTLDLLLAAGPDTTFDANANFVVVSYHAGPSSSNLTDNSLSTADSMITTYPTHNYVAKRDFLCKKTLESNCDIVAFSVELSLADYSVTHKVRYDFTVPRLSGTSTLSALLAKYSMKLSFPKTGIFYYHMGSPVCYKYSTTNPDVPSSINISNIIPNDQNNPTTGFECSFTFPAAALEQFRLNRAYFPLDTQGKPHPSPDQNQYMLDLQLIDPSSGNTMTVAYGNPYTEAQWATMIGGSVSPSPGTFQLYQNSFGTIQVSNVNGESKHYISYKLVYLLNENPRKKEIWFNFLWDSNSDVEKRDILKSCNIYNMPNGNSYGSVTVLIIDSSNGSSADFHSKKIIFDTTGPEVTTPWLNVEVHCDYYRYVDINVALTGRSPREAEATRIAPMLQIRDIFSNSAQTTTLIRTGGQYFPKFIPTPSIYIKSSTTSIDKSIDQQNFGISIESFNTNDSHIINILPSFDISSTSNIPATASNSNMVHLFYTNEVQQDENELRIIKIKFNYSEDSQGDCALTSTYPDDIIFTLDPTKDWSIELVPKELRRIVNDDIRQCVLSTQTSFIFEQNPSQNSPISSSHLSIPVWKRSEGLNGENPDTLNFVGLTFSASQTANGALSENLTYPLSSSPSFTVPGQISYPNIYLPYNTIVILHLCYFALPNMDSNGSFIINFQSLPFNPLTLATKDPTSVAAHGFPKLDFLRQQADLCIYGLQVEILPANFSSETFFHLSLASNNSFSPTPPFPTMQYSSLFGIGSPLQIQHQISDLKLTTSLGLFQYQPKIGPKIQIFNTKNNILDITFALQRKDMSSSSFSISFSTPIWITLDLSGGASCDLTDSSDDPIASYTQLVDQPSVSAINRDLITHSITIPDFFSTGTTDINGDPIDGNGNGDKYPMKCLIPFTSNSKTSINPTIPIPITPVMIKYHTGDTIPKVIQQTLNQVNGVFLHPNAAGVDTSCNIDLNNPFAQCVYTELPIITTPTAPTTPPPPTTKLPTTTRGLTGVCDLVLTNKNSVDVYTDAKYSKMCSIPIAGTLSNRITTRTELIASHPTLSLDSFPIDKTDFSLCDCKCKGYWYDDVMNQDYKKCSKCVVPQCPELLTPNSDCTACECITVQCKQFRTYVFSTIYFKPEVLRYIVDVDAADQTSAPPVVVNYNSQSLTNLELSTLLYSPSTETQLLYFNTIGSFSTALTKSIQDQIALSSDADAAGTHSTLESVTITPLVEGSFTVWKVTLSIINHSQQPLSTLAPLYGLPPVEDTIGQMFGAFHTEQRGLLGAVTPPQLELDVTSPTLSNTSNLKLFTTDVIKTGCLSRVDAKVLGLTAPATADMLHACPLPNQYTIISNDPTKTDLLNPLWSSCSSSSSSSSSSSLSKFTKYESLLDLTAVSTVDLRVREIYPRCIDFAGVDVGLLHVTCNIDKSNILYSSASSTLLLPTYTQSLLSSFTTSALDSVVAKRIEDLKSTPLPKFPSFPQLTVVPCPDTSSSSSSSSTSTNQGCPVGYYGPGCSLENEIEPASMFTSPTILSTQSHSHIQWEYMGDTTQELTLVLQSSHVNSGQGYFAWSQLLGTVPVASLYASAQIPTIDQSKLFQYIYDAIETGNTAFTAVYNADTEIIIRGYFTRGASQGIGLDPDQIVEKFTFKLPMLCTDFRVECRESTSQYCNQSDGRCHCRAGFVNANPDQARSPNYIVETVSGSPDTATVNIDGDDLQCVSICHNGGEWDTITDSCSCLDGTSGDRCEVVEMCDVQRQELCSDVKNGYVGLVVVDETQSPYQLQSLSLFSPTQSQTTCSTTCDCFGKWTKPFEPTPPTTPKSCGFCPLKPLSRQLYTETTITDLDDILTNYKTDSKLAPHATYDEKYTQTYQPPSTESEPLTQQRCYITGTDQVTYQPGNCSQCMCQRGYGGDYCQLHIAYATITYTPGVNNKYTYDAMTEVLLFDKIGEELSLSMTNFDKSKLFIVQHNTDQHWIEVGFYSGLDFFTRNQDLLDQQQQQQQQQSQSQQSQLQIQSSSSSSSSSSSPFTTLSTTITTILQTLQSNTGTNTPFSSWNLPPTNYNTQLPTNLDNLYTQWGQLQQGLPQAPITNQDSNKFLGDIDIKEPVQDPVCFDQGLLGCSGEPPSSGRASGKGLLIGLVVGLVGAALLFIILVVVLLWCKKHKRGFWKSKEDQDRDEMSNFVPTTRKEFTGSTNAPSMTVGTLSIMPVIAGGGDGVEMSNTGSASGPASSVQSVNNHTEVKDPTLPAGYKAYKDAKSNVFYINTETMTTSWVHPNDVGKDGEKGDGNYGSDW